MIYFFLTFIPFSLKVNLGLIKIVKVKKPKNIKNKSQEVTVDSKKFIIIKGAKVHNLKNISINIPKYKLVVFTGVSGSGKSSLVFDTIYAEGQRRYVESLSSYARQFLEKMNKPEVDSITGLAPSMAIEQKASSKNSRSTVGTSTEIYDYLRLLYARIGDTYSPVSGKIVKKDSPSSIIKEVSKKDKQKIFVLANIKVVDIISVETFLNNLREKGYYKIILGVETLDLNDLTNVDIIKHFDDTEIKEVHIIIDRMNYDSSDAESVSRLTESLEMAFNEGHGFLTLRLYDGDNFKDKTYNKYYILDGITFEEPEPRLFSFNNPPINPP